MNFVFRAISYVGSGLIVALVLLTGADIAARYFFSAPIIGVTEITCLVLVVIGSLAIVDSTAADEHIRVDSIYERIGSAGQRVLRRVATLTGVIVFGALTWQSAVSFVESIFTFYETTDRLSWPVWPVHLVLALTFLISFVISIGQLVTDRSRWWSPEEKEEDEYEKVV
jgi:TRAP-type transport system small permease protein